ncbi:Uncharacterised protein [Mycobacterium tuberculosis]|nr:Uncharacterised protein [Mycobacterium tuberculosis]
MLPKPALLLPRFASARFRVIVPIPSRMRPEAKAGVTRSNALAL